MSVIPSPAFGEFVSRLMEGRSAREVARSVGVNHTTLCDMRQGVVPKPATLERFAQGMLLSSADRDRLFTLALGKHHAPADAEDPLSANLARALARIEQLERRVSELEAKLSTG